MGSSKSCFKSWALGRLGKEPIGSFFHSLFDSLEFGVVASDDFGVVASDDLGVVAAEGENGRDFGVVASGPRKEGI